MSNFKYPKGSEWRKWDLQIHTPFSILNNQFGDPNNEETWDNYVKELFKSNRKILLLLELQTTL